MNAVDAVERLRRGEVDGALAALTEAVRRDPSSAKLRVFLFQLLCVTGAWERAKTQLEVAQGMDPETELMARVYGGAIACEEERRKAFAGEAAPTIFGDPLSWMAELYEALRLDAKGEHAAAADLRGRAFEAAPATPGRIGEEPFEWIADADGRLGPLLEAIINGRYFWLPFLRIARIEIDPPSDLRDQVWMPVRFTFANGGETVGLIPTRYVGSEKSDDPLIRLARKTDWAAVGEDSFAGQGQRLLATDGGDHALMDLRSIVIDPPAGDEAPASGNG